MKLEIDTEIVNVWKRVMTEETGEEHTDKDVVLFLETSLQEDSIL